MKNHELVASLAFKMNEIVYHYDNQLINLKQNEELNKHLMTSLSHDVRTPLTTLIGYLHAVRKGIVTGQEKDSYIDIACRKAGNLKNIQMNCLIGSKFNQMTIPLLLKKLT
ncbi:hypothetical protein O3Q48_07135 [Enterococcus lactis]